MADISSVTLPNGDTYNFKDTEARKKRLFWCEYNDTTYSEIYDAISAGMLPVCAYRGKIYVYSREVSVAIDFREGYFFYAVNTFDDGSWSGVSLFEIRCEPTSEWSDISSFALATEDYVDDIVGDIESLLAAI